MLATLFHHYGLPQSKDAHRDREQVLIFCLGLDIDLDIGIPSIGGLNFFDRMASVLLQSLRLRKIFGMEFIHQVFIKYVHLNAPLVCSSM
jgi:hypothetical protein